MDVNTGVTSTHYPTETHGFRRSPVAVGSDVLRRNETVAILRSSRWRSSEGTRENGPGYVQRRSRFDNRANKICSAQLFHKFCTSSPQDFHMHVMGIHADRGQLWIQLQPSPESSPGLVLRVSSATRLDAAMEALRTTKWGSERPHIVDAIRPDRRRRMTRASA